MNSKLHHQVYFNVTISLNSCLDDSRVQEVVTIAVRPIGYNESTLVHIRSKCGCSCGTAQCCYDYQHQDRQYQADCSGLQGGTGDGQGAGCRADGSEVDCSGRGVCECGRCVCEQSKLGAVYGKHCEVDDFSCPYAGGLLCAGEGMEKVIHPTSSLSVSVLNHVCLPPRQRCMCVRRVRVR